jgi:choline dehydrogenase-like flavoprotein
MIISRYADIPARHLKPEILVVGAGAVGIPIAVALARLGRRVTLIEGGTDGPIDVDYTKRNPNVITGLLHNGILSGRAKVLGGTTTLWGGQLVPFGRTDFEGAYPGAPRWPVTYAEIYPWFEAAFRFLKIPPAALEKSRILRELGIDADTFGSSIAISTHLWLKEPDFSRLFRSDLEQLESLAVLVETSARGFEFSPSGAISAVLCQTTDGTQLRVAADQTVLANGTMEISRLLLHAKRSDPLCPFSQNPHIGQHFVDHLHGIVGHLEQPDRKRLQRIFDTARLRGSKYTFKLRASDELLEARGISNCAATLNGSTSVRGLISDTLALLKRVSAGGDSVPLATAIARLWSSARVLLPLAWRYVTSGRSYSFVGKKVFVGIELEQVPTGNSRLFVPESPDGSAAVIGLHWDFDGRELTAARIFLDELRRSLASLGLGKLVLSPNVSKATTLTDLRLHDANHHIGGARMAESPAGGVVDRNLKVFGTTNLYVAGAAAFPSGSFANPTLTAIAFALRLADRLDKIRAGVCR